MRLLDWARDVVLIAVLTGCAAEPESRSPTVPPTTASGSSAGHTGVGGGSSVGGADNPIGLAPAWDASTPLAAPPRAPMAMTPRMPIAPGVPISIDETRADNPAGLAQAEVERLRAGGPVGAMKWLYPYEATVFPRGMIAPLFMWNGPAADAVYVRIKAQAFEYQGVHKVTQSANATGPQLQLPQHVWEAAGEHTGGKADPFLLELTARAAEVIAGPIALRFTIADATIKGSIYYNTYASKLPGASPGGNVLRIRSGSEAELFLSKPGECNGCHSVSADGSRMISQVVTTADGSRAGGSYALVAGGAPNPTATAVGARAAFGALYPDGSKFLVTSLAVPVAQIPSVQGQGAPVDATLYDSVTGQVVPDTEIPPGALMPSFALDGKRLVFNDYAIDAAHGLAVMEYDTKSDKASNYKLLMKEPAGDTRPGWPLFLPDSKAVVFVREGFSDFSGRGVGSALSFLIPTPVSDLFIVDVATGTVTILARAMGYDSPAAIGGERTYLPFGVEELHHNFFPTMLSVAAGGYFWVFFDSYRHYGNFGIQRALWVTAIEIAADGKYDDDPSHPAFYLPGQEFGTGNHRAFAALDPCKKDGDACTSGIDCCGGFCFVSADSASESAESVGTCSPEMTACADADCTPANRCATRDERCATDADCCPPENGQPPNLCIAGFCAFVSLT